LTTQELTPRQEEILDFILSSTASNGFQPSYRDIMLRFGIRNPNGVKCHMIALEKKGFIKRGRSGPKSRGLARAVRFTQPISCPHCGKPIGGGQ